MKKLNNNLDTILGEYRNIVAFDSVAARNLIKKLDYKNNFYLLKCIAQTYLDESRFKDGSSELRPSLNMRKWTLAEKYIIKAFTINDDNAEVLYTMGEIRKINGRKDFAIYCFERIIKLGIKRVANQEYSRGEKFARVLINDARFELYRLYYNINPGASKKNLQSFKRERSKGVDTIFKPLNKFLLD
jgi:hypothetical protein